MRSRVRYFQAGLFLVIMSGCAAFPRSPTELVPGAETVRIGEAVPEGNYEQIGLVSAVDGHGCGILGQRGVYRNAENDLKNKAYALGARYVRVQAVTEPHATEGCFRNELKIYGNAYRMVESKEPEAARIAEPAEPSAEPAESLTVPVTDRKDAVQKLRELKSLKEEGILTEEEYQRFKTRVLQREY